jgi:peptidoglycan-associated lipoprotein
MDRKIVWLVLVVSCAFLLVFSGCAQKAAVKESAVPMEEQKVAPQAAQEPQKDTAAEDEARRKAMEEQAMKEQAMKEQEAKEAALFADILFDYDKSLIRTEYRDRLKNQADWFGANSWQKLTVEGNCDERGTSEYNLALGQRRADTAKKYLVELGVDAGKIKTVSYGKEKPLDSGHDEEAWVKNRRDSFVLTK